MWYANDRYQSQLRTTWLSDPADTYLGVTSLPANFPTIVVVGWKEDYETVFKVNSHSGTSPSDYRLTGVVRLKGANENLPPGVPVNCVNNEEFINQFATDIGINWRGAWDNSTAYLVDDGISYQGTSYVSIQAGTNHLPTDTDYWMVVAGKGDTGSQGIQGIQGEPGSVNAASSLDLTQISTPSSPAANHVLVYVKNDNMLYKKDANGVEQKVGGADLLQIQIFS